MGSVSAFVKAIHPHIQIEIEKKNKTLFWFMYSSLSYKNKG